MRATRFLPHLVLAAMLLSVSVVLFASDTGQVKGTVTDQATGKAIPGATVSVMGTNLGAVTDSDGKFIVRLVPPGAYDLRVAHVDYTEVRIKSISVNADRTTEIACSMSRKGGGSEEDGTTSLLDRVEQVSNNRTGEVFTPNVTESQITTSCDKETTVGVSPYMAVPSLYKKGEGNVSGYYPPAHGGTAIVNGEPFDAMFFKNYGVNPFVDTEDDHLSTFAIDVDDASYVMTRSYIERGALPSSDAVRTEEFINHFVYGYPAPETETFRVYVEGAPSRFGQNCSMLRIGIKGKEIQSENRKPANLVFVIDISGSMGREDRLGLVKQALRMLVDELRADDRVGIVVYGSSGRVLLEPRSIAQKHEILSAIEWLRPDGATNAEEGIRLGYDMADRMFERGKINRVVLCSDGVANVGRTGPADILKEIKKYAEKGITLSAIGFGMGNYNDVLMEQLGNKGDGHYAYVDDLQEAKRVFVDNLTGNLQVIAREVKIQIDFDSSLVRSYRLLGYENRDVADELFRVDSVDGGEIGAGHQVTALYEVKFRKQPSSDVIGTIFIRFKDPDNPEKVTEISELISLADYILSFNKASFDFRLAACAAEFGEILRKSYWAKESKLADVGALARELVTQTEASDVVELLSLVTRAEEMEDQLANR